MGIVEIKFMFILQILRGILGTQKIADIASPECTVCELFRQNSQFLPLSRHEPKSG